MCYPPGFLILYFFPTLAGWATVWSRLAALGAWKGECNAGRNFGRQPPKLYRPKFLGFTDSRDVMAGQCATPPGFLILYFFPSPCGLGYRLVAPSGAWGMEGRMQRRAKFLETTPTDCIDRNFSALQIPATVMAGQCATPSRGS